MESLATLTGALSAVTQAVSTLRADVTVHGTLLSTPLADASPETLAKADAALARLETAEPSATTHAASAARRAIKGFATD